MYRCVLQQNSASQELFVYGHVQSMEGEWLLVKIHFLISSVINSFLISRNTEKPVYIVSQRTGFIREEGADSADPSISCQNSNMYLSNTTFEIFCTVIALMGHLCSLRIEMYCPSKVHTKHGHSASTWLKKYTFTPVHPKWSVHKWEWTPSCFSLLQSPGLYFPELHPHLANLSASGFAKIIFRYRLLEAIILGIRAIKRQRCTQNSSNGHTEVFLSSLNMLWNIFADIAFL